MAFEIWDLTLLCLGTLTLWVTAGSSSCGSHPATAVVMSSSLDKFSCPLVGSSKSGLDVLYKDPYQHPQLSLKVAQIPSNRDHEALHRGSLNGLVHDSNHTQYSATDQLEETPLNLRVQVTNMMAQAPKAI